MRAERVAPGKAGVDERPQGREADAARATMTTSRPVMSSTGQPRPRGPRRPMVAPRSSPAIVRVAGPAARIVSSRPSGVNRDTEMGRRRTAGRAAMTN